MFFYYFCLIEESGSGAGSLTNGSGSGRLKNKNFQKGAMFTVQPDTNSMFYVPRTYNSTEHFYKYKKCSVPDPDPNPPVVPITKCCGLSLIIVRSIILTTESGSVADCREGYNRIQLFVHNLFNHKRKKTLFFSWTIRFQSGTMTEEYQLP
jgi:hypothetical protein